MAAQKMKSGGYMIRDIRNKNSNRTVRVTREDNAVRITVQTGSKTAGAIIPLSDLLRAVGQG